VTDIPVLSIIYGVLGLLTMVTLQ